MRARITMDDLLPEVGEQLMHVAMGALLGDSTIRAWGRHGRQDIHGKDSAGRSKVDTYRDVLVGNIEWFDDLVERIRRDPFELARSLRTEIERIGRDPRPIEDPAEEKRVLLLFVLSVIQEHLEDLLYEGQLGGRPARYATPWCPRHRATVLDHAAWRTWNLIRGGRRYVVLVDLEKAYTYLPRKAVLDALRRAGFEGRAAEWIWRLVQLDSLDKKTRRPIKTSWYRGEEQGNSLSTLILNLVVSKVLKRIEGRLGIPSVAYVDDLYFLCESRDQAEACLKVLDQMFKSEGITLRKLGQPKGPELIDTDESPVLLLKTYRIDAAGIEFTFGKVLDTWARAQKMGLRGKTIGRRMFLQDANNQAVTKSFFTTTNVRRIPRGTIKVDPKWNMGLSFEEGLITYEKSDPVVKAMSKDTNRGTIGNLDEGNLVRVLPHGESSPLRTRDHDDGQVVEGQQPEERTSLRRDQPGSGDEGRDIEGVLPRGGGGRPESLGHQCHGEHLHLRPGVSRSKDSPEKSCVEGDRGTVSMIDDGGSSRVSHHRHPVDSGHPVDPGDEGASSSQGDTPPHRILHVDHPQVLAYLHGRRPLGLSDKHRVHYELNLKGLGEHLGGDQGTRELVVRGLLKAVRFMNQVEVVYPPWEAWTAIPTLLGNHHDPDYLRVADEFLDTGERRVVLRRRPRGRRRPDRGKLPNTDVVVLKVSCIDLANRLYLAKVRDRGTRHTRLSIHHVPGPEWLGPQVVNAEVVAANPGRSVAFRSSASLRDGLLDGVRPINAGLAEVVRLLRRARHWGQEEGWFIGTGKPTTPTP